MKEVSIKAHAKINLSLDVTGVLPNGYHTVAMIMQSIGLCDELTASLRNDESIVITIDGSDLPTGPDNLIYKACMKFNAITGNTRGVNIGLKKNIPVAAGMAGGSTDAAATLKALNELLDTRLSEQELREIGVKIGADVPFCIMGGTALAEGIGEILTPLPKAPDCHLLIVKPGEGMSTKYVYDNLVLDENTIHPDIESMKAGLAESSLDKICASLGNVLESVTIKEIPVIADLKKEMLALGARGSLMSGSGSTVFGIFDDEAAANAAYKFFKNSPYKEQTFLTSLL